MEDKTYTFTVDRAELAQALKDLVDELKQHRANDCYYGGYDYFGMKNDCCDCPEGTWK